MGGKAFEGDGIVTPRMPTKMYRRVLREVEEKLLTIFEHVAHAIEGPEKTTHGDLDVLFVENADPKMPSVGVIAQMLGALKWTGWQKNGVAQFAIPWPTEDQDDVGPEPVSERISETEIIDDEVADGNRLATPSILDGKTVKKCIQVDLNRFSNPEDMRWQLFNTSHGDLCNILSNIVRSKGLTINTEALWLRIASVEKYHRKAGRIELSRDPEQVLQYFGLDPIRFWQPFDTLDEMMRYAATSRFFQPVRQRVDNNEASLYWTDQKYLNVRPIFTYWIDTYLPAHRSDAPGRDAHLTREETLDDVFDFFGPKAKETYMTQKLRGDVEIARQFLWPNVRSVIREKKPEISDDDMNDTIKGIKRVSQHDLPRTDGDVSYTTVREAYQSEKYDAVITWAAEHHNEVLKALRAGELENIVTFVQGPVHKSGSTRPVETYSKEDDEIIKRMKGKEGATWPEILKTIGKKSKSQIQARWKLNLQDTTSG